MSQFDKFTEQFSLDNGSIRRSIVSGFIFIFFFLVHYVVISRFNIFSLPNLPGFQLKDLIQSTSFLILNLLLVFAIGSVIDTITDGFIIRGISMSSGWITKLLTQVEKISSSRLIGLASVILTVPLWPWAILLGSVFGTAGFKRFAELDLLSNDPRIGLSDEAREFYDLKTKENSKKPWKYVFNGLKQPLGDRFDAAWQEIIRWLPDECKPWVNRKISQTRDLSAFLTSMLLALSFSTIIYMANNDWRINLPVLASYALICFISYCLYGYFDLVKRKIVSVLELAYLSEVNQDIHDK